MAGAVAVGSAAPDFVYTRADGESCHLRELWADGPALIVWLRHFG